MSCESYNKLIESLSYIDDKASLEKQAQYINDAISLLENVKRKKLSLMLCSHVVVCVFQ